MERKGIGLKQNQSSTQRKQTPTYPRVTRKNISVNMVNTRSNNGQKTEEKLREEPIVPVMETELETPDQSIHGAERKMTEWTPMPNAEEQGTKTIDLSPAGNGDEITNNTPETIKYYSQTRRTSFTERFAAMVGMKPREKEEVKAATEKNFCTFSAITTETKQDKEQVTQGTVSNQDKRAIELKVPSVELADLMTKLEQIDKKQKRGDEDRQELKKELRHNKSENLDNYFVLARSTEEKLQQKADKVDITDKERLKHIKKYIEEIKKRTV